MFPNHVMWSSAILTLWSECMVYWGLAGGELEKVSGRERSGAALKRGSAEEWKVCKSEEMVAGDI